MGDAGPELDPRQEEAWIRAAQAGDHAAFDALVEAHGRSVLAFLRRLTGSEPDAEDLAQETLIRAFSGLKGFQPGSRFRAWLLTIAYHEWVHVRRRKNRLRLVETEVLDRQSKGGAEEDAVSTGEVAEKIRQSVARLPEDQRAVVWLRFGEGLSHEQIAAVVDADPATVRWRLYRARQVMRKSLMPWVEPLGGRAK